jgi:hypothetical protein
MSSHSVMTLKEAKRLLRSIGIDPRALSDTDVLEGAEAARRISACDYVPGASGRRPQAVADWRAFVVRNKHFLKVRGILG